MLNLDTLVILMSIRPTIAGSLVGRIGWFM